MALSPRELRDPNQPWGLLHEGLSWEGRKLHAPLCEYKCLPYYKETLECQPKDALLHRLTWEYSPLNS